MSQHLAVWVGNLITVTGIVLSNTLLACSQAIPDNTLGNENSRVTPRIGVNGLESDYIDGGAFRGSNLFHSFQEFNVNDGKGAYFANPNGIENIFSRVTGGSPSNILGTLGVLGDANLFFINPNGIVFGENSRLDLGGSFIASTADRLVFANGFEFGVGNPQAPPLFTSSLPMGLQFRDRPGSIINQSSAASPEGISTGLRVRSGEILALLGGDILLENGHLEARGGNIQLGGLSTTGTINFNFKQNGISFIFPINIVQANVFLTNSSALQVSSEDGGYINITSQNVGLYGGSTITAGITSGNANSESIAGDIQLNVIETVVLDESSSILNGLGVNSNGISGDITIEAGSLLLLNGGNISSSALLGSGDSGRIIIASNGAIVVDGTGEVRSSISNFSSSTENFSNGGITIYSNDLLVSSGGIIVSSTSDSRQRESISINVNETLAVDGESPSGEISTISTIILPTEDSGNFENDEQLLNRESPGLLQIRANNIFLTSGASISSLNSGVGNTSDIYIEARESLIMSGESLNGTTTAIRNSITNGSVGNAGNIGISSRNFYATGGATIDSSSDGEGNAGNISIRTLETFILDGESSTRSPSLVVSGIDLNGLGNGGNIQINSGLLSINQGAVLAVSNGIGNAGSIELKANDSLLILNGGEVQASTFGIGDSGVVILEAREDIIMGSENPLNDLSDSSIATLVHENAVGNSQGVVVSSNNLLLLNNSFILAGTRGIGNGGNIILDIQDEVNISPGTIISSAVFETGIGNSGDIFIDATNFDISGGGLLVSSQGDGSPGNLNIVSSSLNLNTATFNADSITGQGGNINVRSNDIQLRRQSLFTASGSVFNPTIEGNINVQAGTIALLEGSQFITSSALPQGGSNIQISPLESTGVAVFVSPDSLINARGNLSIDTELEVGSTDLPELEVVNPNALISQNPCVQGTRSELTDIGTGGQQVSPDEVPSFQTIPPGWIETDLPSDRSLDLPENVNPQVSPTNLLPARGWVLTPNNRVEFTTDATSSSPPSTYSSQVTCTFP